MAFLLVAIATAAWAASMPTADAGVIRREQPAPTSSDAVLAELDLALTASNGTAEIERSVANMTEVLRPVFVALPRSKEGYLEASAVRYLLHRYFIDRDGWFVQGSDASGEAANNSLPEVVLGGGALARLLSTRLAARGLTLREVAVLAVALETLANDEVVQRLHASYSIVGLVDKEAHATEDELSRVIDVYLQIYSLGYSTETTTWRQVNATWKVIYQVYPHWDELKMWAREVRSEVLQEAPELRGLFSGLARAMLEVQHRYGRWQDQECLSIKKALQEHATPGTGRVPLSAFYSTALPGGWKPNESRDYLLHTGALDDTEPSSPAVVIPNYFDTPSNCARPSRYYSVCCISECEALLGHLERRLGSPDALPSQIVDIVEHLPSTTVEAPRTLPAQLVKRLESVAAVHGGHAPLYGRLFRQWMHHAFPSECSFPALSSTKKLLTAAEFTEQTGKQAYLLPTDLQQLEQRAAKNLASKKTRKPASIDAEPFTFAVDVLADELPWSDEEELFITYPASPWRPTELMVARVTRKGIAGGLLLLAGAGTSAFLLARVKRSVRAPLLHRQSAAAPADVQSSQ